MKGLPREHTLYGLGRYLRDEPQGLKHVYVVEGYADVWKCWVAGIPAVSSFGNRMSRGQVDLLARLGIYRVTVMYDNDKAGYDGAWSCKRVGDKVLDMDFAMEYGLDGPKDPGDASVEFLQALAQNRKDRP
jgi:DNA primase